MTFLDLNLIPALQEALVEINYTNPTTIQSQAIPHILNGEDVLGNAQTGTGKTAAFAIPILQRLVEQNPLFTNKKIRCLVLTPTRELAIQIDENFSLYGKYTKIRNAVIFGGVPQGKQVEILKNGADILVATPGRLLDLISQGLLSIKEIEYFVLDEADRMLDMGFVNDIKKIIAMLPKKRQSLFFSATMPPNIRALADEILNNPIAVAVDTVSSTAETIQQKIYTTNKNSKHDLLMHILQKNAIQQVLIFSRTKHGADRIAKNLVKENIKCAAIHGEKSQNQRQKALNDFKNKKISVLVATDIAARGIDIDKLLYVINYDIPNEAETYVHRIGRCGRAGESGIAISLCEPEEITFVKDIEKLIKKKIEVVQDNPYPQTDKPMTTAEKKEFEKEKNRRKQEFFAKRKENKARFRK